MALLFQSTGVLSAVIPFFVAIFVWTATYAALLRTKPFGEQKGLYSLIAFVFALLVFATPDLVRLISIVIPWFFFLMLFATLVMIGIMLVSPDPAKEGLKGFWDALGGSGGVTWVFVVIGGIIIALAAGSVYGDMFLSFTTSGQSVQPGGNLTTPSPASDSFKENLAATLFHPAILGFITLILIATFTILFLG